MSDETTGSAAGSPVDWNNLGGLPDDQLNVVAEAALTVLQRRADEGDAAYVEELTSMPPGPLGRELRAALAENGLGASEDQARQLVNSREAALAVLEQIAREPELARAVEQVLCERQGMMFVEPGTLLAGALLLLVIKLKRVRVSREGADVEFRDLKADVLEPVRKLLGQ
jgi:hypothetical protein